MRGICKKQMLVRCIILVIIYIVVFNIHSTLIGGGRSCVADCPNAGSGGGGGGVFPWQPASGDLHLRARQAALERRLSPAKELPQDPALMFHDHQIRLLRRRNVSGASRGLGGFRDGGTVSDQLFKVQGEFLFNDSRYGAGRLPLFPDEADPSDDRIWNQMRYVPRKVLEKTALPKKILLYNGLNEPAGNQRLVADKCPVQNCYLTGDRSQAASADVILWQHSVYPPLHRRPRSQVWAVFFLESPHHTPPVSAFTAPNLRLNWTATYRHDSVIVAPYYKFTPYSPITATRLRGKYSQRNFAAGKRKKVAWFVSNCGAQNGRLQYAEALSKHIQVDIYGACGRFSCPRSRTNSCFRMLSSEYKFYLAFENSNCRDYITEKFFLNGLSNDILPVVMGAHPNDYRRVAPPHSFIHVDDFAEPRLLADYLKLLDSDDKLYNEYFAWKGTGLVDTNTFFWCRLCAMAHEAERHHFTYNDPERWWRTNKCVTGGWPRTKRGR